MYHLINGRRVVENYDDNKQVGFSTTNWIGVGIASGILLILISLLIWSAIKKKSKGGGRTNKFKYKFY